MNFSIESFKTNPEYLEITCGADPDKWEQWRKFYTSYLKDLEKKKYIYMLTFTICTKKIPDHKERESEIEEYIKKQMKRKPLQVVSSYIVKEFTKSDVAHWHVSVEVLKPLKKDRFHYYTQKYGFIDINRTKAQNQESALNYMSKTALPVPI